MTTSPFQDAVGIDTNVFEHLLNKKNNNADDHINELLIHLWQQNIVLLVDDGGRIAGEYNHQVGPIIQNADDERIEVFILRYWINYAPRREVAVNGSGQLMTAIRGVIKDPADAADRIFVYVAFHQGRWLISNDMADIVEGPARERTPRRNRLRQGTRRFRPDGADILTSQEAHAAIQV